MACFIHYYEDLGGTAPRSPPCARR